MHKRERVYRVQRRCADRARVFGDDHIVVAGIGIAKAAAAGGNVIEAAFVQGLEKRDQVPGRFTCCGSNSCSPPRNCPAAM